MRVRTGLRCGGRRDGSAPNRTTLKRREVAARALEEGITPLDVLLRTMRALWAVAQGPKRVVALDVAKEEAAEIAKDAAPYVYPRLASVVTKTDPTYNPWQELFDLVKPSPVACRLRQARHCELAEMGNSQRVDFRCAKNLDSLTPYPKDPRAPCTSPVASMSMGSPEREFPPKLEAISPGALEDDPGLLSA